jgi:hypothetical protein
MCFQSTKQDLCHDYHYPSLITYYKEIRMDGGILILEL